MSTSTTAGCAQLPEHPAQLPKTPPSDPKSCEPWTGNSDGPPIEKPKSDCADPDPACKCPTVPKNTSDCLVDLIADQASAITKADKAKEFKADLEAFLAKAKAAAQDYTADKYKKLRDDWVKEDADIAELVRRLVCAWPCWKCVIECYVCPLLNDMHDNERWLYGDGTALDKGDATNLYDVRYWYERDADRLKRQLDRVKAVLTAWEKPAQTLDKALADNRKLITDAQGRLGSDPRVIFDVFLRLVPMHLAIAPPDASTLIAEEYTQFCPCDKGDPEDCCGPDVGVLSFRDRLLGPQPYLIDPASYFPLICCIVQNRYGPAKNALSDAQAKYQKADDAIKRVSGLIDDGLKSFDKNAKAVIPSTLDCCGATSLPTPPSAPTAPAPTASAR